MNEKNGTTTFPGEPGAMMQGVLPDPLQGSSLKALRANENGLMWSAQDLAMLSAVQVWGVLGLGQLLALRLRKDLCREEAARLLFNEVDRPDYWTRGWTRIEQLRRAGYLRRHSFPHWTSVFTLTKKGFEHLISHGESRIDGFRRTISGSLVTHEITTAAVGLVLKKLWQVGVRVDRAQYGNTTVGRYSREGIPVSDLWAPTEEGEAGVEIELVQKSGEVYGRRWPAHRNNHRVPILYITGFPNGVDCILEHASRLQTDYVYACSLKDFRRSLGAAPFIGYRTGQTISLAEGR